MKSIQRVTLEVLTTFIALTGAIAACGAPPGAATETSDSTAS